jgi:predicted membrane protein
VGDVEVLVPRSADVRVDVSSGVGEVDVLDLDSDGGFSRGTGSAAWTGDGQPEIELTIDAGIGDVEVRRA